MQTNPAVVYAGVGVAKATLQLHLQGQQSEFSNTPKGLRELCAELQKVPNVHVICEATGGYERALVKLLHQEQIPVSVTNPARVRAAAQAQWLKQLIHGRALAKTQAEHHQDPFVRRQHAKLMTHLHSQIEAVEKQIEALLEQDAALQQRVNCLDEIQGVGPRTAWMVLAQMPELGQLNRHEVAALAGLAPWTRESGTMKGMRCIGGGRPEVRLALYMAALSAARCNPVLRTLYKRLRAKGKLSKVALTAVMRRLLTYMNHCIKALLSETATAQTEVLLKA